VEVTRPRLLDLFCGAGGAAMGYHRAGFDVTGVDIAPLIDAVWAMERSENIGQIMSLTTSKA